MVLCCSMYALAFSIPVVGRQFLLRTTSLPFLVWVACEFIWSVDPTMYISDMVLFQKSVTREKRSNTNNRGLSFELSSFSSSTNLQRFISLFCSPRLAAMGKRPTYDLEYAAHGGVAYYAVSTAPPPPTFYQVPSRKPWVAWLVPLIFVVDVAMFVFTMYENNCPETFEEPKQCLFREQLGRFSFLPLQKNPLLGPTSITLQRLGGLQLQLVQHGESWRLLSCLWLHAGAVHLVANMLSLLFIGTRLEEEFGFLRIGPLYLISGFGGSLLSSLHLLVLTDKANVVSVGASGALFGLLGAMLSELITNWTIYTNKCSALSTLIATIALNLAVGFIPGVDNSAHIGGFLSGFLLGFILLIRPQYGYVSRKYLPPGYNKDKRKSKHKCYQYFFCAVALIVLTLGYTYGLLKLLKPATFEKINDRLMEKLQHFSKVNY
ncbi:hypothetical protein Droror1_Dr00010011 [Drosera rotundifolia]